MMDSLRYWVQEMHVDGFRFDLAPALARDLMKVGNFPGGWENPELRVIGMLLLGEATDDVDEQGRPTVGDSLLLLLNGSDRPSYFQLPAMPDPGRWHKGIDTARPGRRTLPDAAVNLAAHSLILLTHERLR